MADLALELADLNANARELLSKYDGVFTQLDTETQNKILTLQQTADDLKAQIESLGQTISYCQLGINGAQVVTDGNKISFRVIQKSSDNVIELINETDIKINKDGLYKIDLTFLTNDANSNGDGRIRINGIDYVGFYASNDSASYKKSCASCIVNLKNGDILTFIAAGDQSWWGSTSGYTHSSLNITRIGIGA